MGMLYFIVEVFRTDETLGEELSEFFRWTIADPSDNVSTFAHPFVSNAVLVERQAAQRLSSQEGKFRSVRR